MRRIELGIQQQALAKKLGVGRGTLLKIGKGNYDDVKIGLAKNIAKALNMSVEELFLKE